MTGRIWKNLGISLAQCCIYGLPGGPLDIFYEQDASLAQGSGGSGLKMCKGRP